MGDRARNTHMLPVLIVVRILDLVEIVFVQLPDERRKVGVFEHPGQDRFCELIHVLDYKTAASGTPRNDMLKIGVFEHSKGFVQSVSSKARNGSILVQLLHEIGR